MSRCVESALGRLLEAHQAVPKQVCAIRKINTADAEDVAQDAAVVALEKWPTAGLPDEAFGPWYRQVCRNVARRFGHQKRSDRALATGHTVVAVTRTPEDLAVAAETRREAAFLLASTSPRRRELFARVMEQDEPAADVASEAGLSTKALRREIGRAVSRYSLRLRRYVAAYCEEG